MAASVTQRSRRAVIIVYPYVYVVRLSVRSATVWDFLQDVYCLRFRFFLCSVLIIIFSRGSRFFYFLRVSVTGRLTDDMFVTGSPGF